MKLAAAVLAFVFPMIVSALIRQRGAAAGWRLAQRSSSLLQAAVPHVLVPIANGSEEIEAVTIIDTLVRGGVKVTSATVHAGDSLQVTCSRGVKLVADCRITDVLSTQFDMIVCPGGMPGSEHLRDSVALTEMLNLQQKRGGMIGAICAAPAVVLKTHGFLSPATAATGYPADKFKQAIGDGYVADEQIVVSGNIVTSQGPGTAMAFSLKLVEVLVDREKAAAVAKEMLTPLPK